MTAMEIVLIVLLALNMLFNASCVFCCVGAIFFRDELKAIKKTAEVKNSAEQEEKE